jgi:hypothetical protein
MMLLLQRVESEQLLEALQCNPAFAALFVISGRTSSALVCNPCRRDLWASSHFSKPGASSSRKPSSARPRQRERDGSTRQERRSSSAKRASSATLASSFKKSPSARATCAAPPSRRRASSRRGLRRPVASSSVGHSKSTTRGRGSGSLHASSASSASVLRIVIGSAAPSRSKRTGPSNSSANIGA